MKNNILSLFILFMILSCSSKIKDVQIKHIKNVKNYKGFISNEEIFDFKKRDTIFIYHPISFRIENNTGRNLKISSLKDNFQVGVFYPFIYNNKYFNEVEKPIELSSGDDTDITMFVHLPVPANLLEKKYLDELLISCNDIKCDTVSIKEINPRLQFVIDSLLKKKSISAHLYEDNDFYGGALVMYCVNKQKSETFKMDSLSKQKTSFRYNCD
ncbi:hypothetical protein [Flavobacterium sp.]|uniref:hypothetical protein n=1 Tax=Flavobacterium sp. TaxID=239 RepID=UPI00286E0F6F|nr:hypothetical protein [Flavobacterium sp.]